MATLARTAVDQPHVLGDLKVRFLDFTCDTDYTTGATGTIGGYALTPAHFGLDEIIAVFGSVAELGQTVGGGAVLCRYNQTAQKLVFYANPAGGTGTVESVFTEVTVGANLLDGMVVRLVAFGR